MCWVDQVKEICGYYLHKASLAAQDRELWLTTIRPLTYDVTLLFRGSATKNDKEESIYKK